jgi:hypothetical protein
MISLYKVITFLQNNRSPEIQLINKIISNKNNDQNVQIIMINIYKLTIIFTFAIIQSDSIINFNFSFG